MIDSIKASLLILLCFFVACAGRKQVRDLDKEELEHLERLSLDLESTEGMNAMMGGAVQAVILSHAQDVDACYKRELKKKPKLEGNVTVLLAIEMNGKLSNYKMTKSTLKDSPTESCVERLIRKMDFPTSDKPMDVTYTFKFTKEKEEKPYELPKPLPVPVIPAIESID